MPEPQVAASLPDWIKDHIALYLKDPEAGHHWDASHAGGKGVYDTLLLTTTGRKSGQPIMLPLIYQPTGDGGYCIVASKGGAPAHPAWYLNLLANPEVLVQAGTEKFKGKARVAEGDERARLWKMMARYFPPYEQYRKATDREIPVVVLERT